MSGEQLSALELEHKVALLEKRLAEKDEIATELESQIASLMLDKIALEHEPNIKIIELNVDFNIAVEGLKEIAEYNPPWDTVNVTRIARQTLEKLGAVNG